MTTSANQFVDFTKTGNYAVAAQRLSCLSKLYIYSLRPLQLRVVPIGFSEVCPAPLLLHHVQCGFAVSLSGVGYAQGELINALPAVWLVKRGK